MHSDNKVDGKSIVFKIECVRKQSQVYLNQLTVLNQQLSEINRLHHFDIYVQKLNEIGKIIQNLVQIINNIEQLQLELSENDRIKLDRQICFLRTEIDRKMSEFNILRNQAEASSIDENISTNDNNNTEQDIGTNELLQECITTTRFADSYHSLERELILLHETIGEVGQLIAQQGEIISNIQDSIDMTNDQIRSTSTLLKKAVHNKYITLASGALIGACLGGPLGCIVGLKVGALTALSGSAVGALSANIMKSRDTK